MTTTPSKPTGKVLRFLATWWTTGLAVPLSPIFFAAATLTTTNYFDLWAAHHISWTVTLFVLGAVTGLVGTEETYRKLEGWRRAAGVADEASSRSETAELALIETICDELRTMISVLALHSNGRASLFICMQDHFVLAGRYSPMAQFGRSLGREAYPMGAGVLVKAWNDGDADAPELPEPGPINRPAYQSWLQAQSRWGIPEDVASKFAMRTRSYAALRLEYDRRRLGVVVIESTLPAQQTAASRLGGAPGGSLDALKALDTGSQSIAVLSRALHHLRHLDGSQLRERIMKYLPDR